MSGNSVPYQLRTNKFVERQLFLDLINLFVRVWNGPTEYVYVSMGGPFLEDFKHVNSRCAIENMVSLESDKTTWERQQFNSPFGFINTRSQSSSDFIDNFSSFSEDYEDKNFIVWLDYANSSDRFDQLQEYESLIKKLSSGDVIKITLNANPNTVIDRSVHRSLNNVQFEKLFSAEVYEQLAKYIPEGGFKPNQTGKKKFAEFLASCIQQAAISGLKNSNLNGLPLFSCRYSDGNHQMITVTLQVASDELQHKVLDDRLFCEWDYNFLDWKNITEVDVPNLSMKERLFINHLIEVKENAFEVHNELDFQLDKDEIDSIKILRNYIKHYRRCPSFAHIQT